MFNNNDLQEYFLKYSSTVSGHILTEKSPALTVETGYLP